MAFSADEEDKVRRLLKTISFGLFGGEGEGDLAGKVLRLEQLVATLSSQRTTGNVMGGMIRTEIAPGAYTVGPIRMDLDATYPVEFDLWVPDWLLRIKRCQMRIKPAAVRSSVAVSSSAESTPGGGGATSGPSSITSSGASPGDVVAVTQDSFVHNHRFDDYGSDGSGFYTARTFTAYDIDGDPASAFSIEAQNAADLYTEEQHNISTTSSTTNASAPDHTHNVEHTHTTPDHTHPNHSHSLTLAIAEGGSASDLEFTIDGVDRTSALGGPWDAAAVVDITQYLINARMEPVVGAHPVVISSATVGAVEVWFDFYVVVRAIQ